MSYDGSISSAIAIKQQTLDLYLGAQVAFTAGAQMYKIGTRQMQYVDPATLQRMIDKLMAEITFLMSGGRGRSFQVVPRDI